MEIVSLVVALFLAALFAMVALVSLIAGGLPSAPVSVLAVLGGAGVVLAA